MLLKSKKATTTLLNQTEIMTIIGENFEFVGDIKSKGTVRIEGKIIGNIIVQKGIILGEKGIINGNVETEAAIIYGTINGNLKTNQLEIKETGFINGDIQTEVLGIEMGAKYNGNLRMKSQGNTPDEQKTEPKKESKENRKYSRS
jgi:cytoskeletal protein CcmA (bactofilin family)